jgi:alpha-tubulin suppressor-like RCC1 family protein
MSRFSIVSFLFLLLLLQISADAAVVVNVATGDYCSFFIKSDGSLWATGADFSGQLGDGAETGRTTPVQILSSGVKDVAGGGEFTIILKSDGSLWGTGYGWDGELGLGSFFNSSTPQEIVTGNVKSISIATGEYHSFFITSDGLLWGMGDNGDGSLGDDQTNIPSGANQDFVYYPVILASNVSLAAGGFDHSGMVKADGSLWTTGYDESGQLGDDRQDWGTNTWEEIVLRDVVSVAAGNDHTLFLKSDGSLWAMGDDTYGQLGDGQVESGSLIPKEIVSSNVTAIAAKGDFSLFLESDGSLWAMGLNYNGQFGDGTTNAYNPIPEKIVSGGVIAMAAGQAHTVFLKSDGSVWTMGMNFYGQLGDGTNLDSDVPVQLFAEDEEIPSITNQPVNWTTTLGGDASFSVAATGKAPLSYQWQLNGVNLTDMGQISGSLSNTLNLGMITANEAGGYRVIVTNAYGSITSTVAALAIVPFPIITSQPQSVTVGSGAPASFSVAANGTAPLSFQWLENGNALTDGGIISGSLSSNLNLSVVTSINSGNYWLIVSNAYASATSSVAILTVISFPTITRQPQSVVVVSGGSASFSVTAVGVAPLSYQWQNGGTNLVDGGIVSGSSTGVLSLSGVSAMDTGGYTVIVSNAYGSVTSLVAMLTIDLPSSTQGPTIIVQPRNTSALAGQQASFNVKAVGGAPLTYQWFSDTAILTAATNSTLALPSVTAQDAGSYWVIVSSPNGTVDSQVVTLTLLSNPQSNKLEILVTGEGKVSPNYNGQTLQTGRSYTITAIPDSGWLFGNWAGNVITNKPRLKFTMQSNMVLQANFVTNLFIVARGFYNGLFAPATLPREQTNSGSFSFSVTSSGVFSGRLLLDRQVVPLNGKFDINGAEQIQLNRRNQNRLTVTMQLDVANRMVYGAITDGAFQATLNGDLDVFTIHQKATNYAGRYTMVIPGTNDPTIGPYGTSYATVIVTETGEISFVGDLANGIAVSQSSVVSKDGAWPLYIPLYDEKGSLWAWNYFSNHTFSAAASAPASWINEGNSSRIAALRPGFTNQNASMFGSFYNPTNKSLIALDAAEVDLTGGALTNTLAAAVVISANDRIVVTNSKENTIKLNLILNKVDGVISGTFANPANPKQTIRVGGVVLQNLTNAAGYFLQSNQSGAFLLSP